MNKNLVRVFLIAVVLVCMGFAMPTCPGQQEMQLKIDNLQATQVEFTKKIQKLEAQAASVDADMAQVKQLLPQITNVIQSQKVTLDQLGATVQALQHKG